MDKKKIAKEIVLFPSMDYGWAEINYALKGLDMQSTLLICKNAYAEEFKPERAIIDEMDDPEITICKIETWLSENNARCKGVIAIDDDMHFRFSKKLAVHFNVWHYDDQTLDKASNKYLMKKAFSESGVPTSDFELITEPKTRLDYPCIMKVLTSNGSEFMHVVKEEKELVNKFTGLKSATCKSDDIRFNPFAGFDPRKEFLIEGFVNGTEYSLDFLFMNGEIDILRIVKKFKSHHPGYFSGFYLMNQENFQKETNKKEEIIQISRKTASALGITKGVCMLDFMISEGSVFVIETNIRPGFSTFVPLMQRIYGYTSLRILHELMMGMNPKPIPSQTEGLVANIIAPHSGRIIQFDASSVKEIPGFVSIHKSNDVGDTLSDKSESHWGLMLGYILLENINDPETAMTSVKNYIHLVIE